MTRLIRTILVALALIGLPFALASAGGLRELDQTIFGMDCAPCAAGIEKGLRKLDGIRAVRVSLNEGKAVVSLAPDSRTTLAQIREVIRHNGFTPKSARATFVGRVVREGDRWWIETSSGRFVLEADSKALQSYGIPESTNQELTLLVRVPETLSSPPTVQLVGQDRTS